MNRQALDDAARFATCRVLSAAGEGLIGAAVFPLWPAPYRAGAIGLGALSILGSEALCAQTPVGPAKPGQGGGCQEMASGGYGQLQTSFDGNWAAASCGASSERATRATKISRVYVDQSSSSLKYRSVCEFEGTSGNGQCTGLGEYETEGEASSVSWRIDPIEGSCATEPDVPNLPTPAFDDIPYTDPVSNCNYTINLLGFVEEFEGGSAAPVFKIEQAGPSLRADGGIVGGCNFEPTVYYGGSGGSGGGGGGGAPPFPYVPGDGDDGRPKWLDTLTGALAGAAGAIAADAVADAIQAAFATEYPGLIYRMVSVCEKDSSGEPISEAIEVPIPNLKAPDAQLARLDAIVELLQASKNFKQPICGTEQPEPEGEFRTIHFRSASVSPNSNSRLRKRFRYRSTSGLGLDEVIEYWKDFTYQSGPVVVKHVGSSLGRPQVWAASADEGKRVIRHAFGEAGINPDQVGGWRVGSSSSSRLGLSDTMSVDKSQGYYMIKIRDGSDGPSFVA